MSYSQTIVLNKSQNEEHWLPCGHCHVKTKHKALQSIDISREVEVSDFHRQLLDKYQIVQCQGCETVSFRKSHTYSEEYYTDPCSGESEYAEQVEIYPSRVAGRYQIDSAHCLPPKVARIYNETHAALCNKLPVLAGIGIRALVEAICKERAALGKSLEEKIDSLVLTDVLTKDGADILHSLRILGNAAAHEVILHSEDQLSVAMDVVEHLLNGVYILPRLAASLPLRK